MAPANVETSIGYALDRWLALIPTVTVNVYFRTAGQVDHVSYTLHDIVLDALRSGRGRALDVRVRLDGRDRLASLPADDWRSSFHCVALDAVHCGEGSPDDGAAFEPSSDPPVPRTTASEALLADGRVRFEGWCPDGWMVREQKKCGER